MRYSDIKDDPKAYILENVGDHTFRVELLRCLNAICGELDSISYRMKKRPAGPSAGGKVRHGSRGKSKR